MRFSPPAQVDLERVVRGGEPVRGEGRREEDIVRRAFVSGREALLADERCAGAEERRVRQGGGRVVGGDGRGRAVRRPAGAGGKVERLGPEQPTLQECVEVSLDVDLVPRRRQPVRGASSLGGDCTRTDRESEPVQAFFLRFSFFFEVLH